MEKILSIITVCYNSEKTIERCVKSVINQIDNRMEYIIIDGNSKDNTLEIIKKYSNKFLLLSEPDDGIYDAMNKGISKATGKWIIFMNSDDCFIDGKLKGLVDILEKFDEYDCIYGDIEEVFEYKGEEYKRIFNVTDDLETLNKEMLIRHQSFLCKREKMLEIGSFKLEYKVAADWDSLIRLRNNGCKFKKIDYIFSKFYLGGASIKNHVKERHIIRKNNNCYKFVDFKYITDWIHSFNLRRKITGVFCKDYTIKWLKNMGLRK